MLTESKVKNAVTGVKSRKMYDHAGLYIEIRPKPKKKGKPAAKYWRFRYTYENKAKLLSMGVYPGVSLIDARLRRGAAQKLLAAGIDPSAARKAEKAIDTEKAANTVKLHLKVIH